jgi:hypothetical protein
VVSMGSKTCLEETCISKKKACNLSREREKVELYAVAATTGALAGAAATLAGSSSALLGSSTTSGAEDVAVGSSVLTGSGELKSPAGISVLTVGADSSDLGVASSGVDCK